MGARFWKLVTALRALPGQQGQGFGSGVQRLAGRGSRLHSRSQFPSFGECPNVNNSMCVSPAHLLSGIIENSAPSLSNGTRKYPVIPPSMFQQIPFLFELAIVGPPGGSAVEQLSAFGSGRDPGVLGSSPTSGCLRGACSCFSLCLCFCLFLPVCHE